MTRAALPEIPNASGELDTLHTFLDYYRAALLDRAHGLAGTQLKAAHPPSTLTLQRLIGHMVFVEYFWFCYTFAGQEIPGPVHNLNFDADDDAEMTWADTLSVDTLFATFETACADSRARVAGVSAEQLAVRAPAEGGAWNLRWVMVHMIEEYARHCGHADLIRESIDGDVAS